MRRLIAAIRYLLNKPAGRPYRIDCPKCKKPHIDSGIWRYRAHVKHLCHYCGEVFIPYIWIDKHWDTYNKPTRGVWYLG